MNSPKGVSKTFVLNIFLQNNVWQNNILIKKYKKVNARNLASVTVVSQLSGYSRLKTNLNNEIFIIEQNEF